MTTTFTYASGSDATGKRVELTLSYGKGGGSLSPELYGELVALAEKIKAEFIKENQ